MKERINQSQSGKYEEELREAGMPEELDPIPTETSLEGSPVNIKSATGILLEIVPEIEPSLAAFMTLNDKLQDDIVKDLSQRRKTGMSVSEILDRFSILVVRAQELEDMTSDDSDIAHKPIERKSEADDETEEERGIRVDRAIKEIEKIIMRDNFIPGRSKN